MFSLAHSFRNLALSYATILINLLTYLLTFLLSLRQRQADVRITCRDFTALPRIQLILWTLL